MTAKKKNENKSADDEEYPAFISGRMTGFTGFAVRKKKSKVLMYDTDKHSKKLIIETKESAVSPVSKERNILQMRT